MFYPVESLKRGGRFYLCWVADSWPLRFATITHRQLWSQDVRNICDDLMEVIVNESGRPAKRFSLRLSSQLLRGLVRLYQRKVAVILSELCMINANVIKHANKKYNVHDEEAVEHVRHPRPPPLEVQEIFQEQPDAQRVEEMIQTSGNIVSNIQDITLKETAIPEVVLPNDGFGEENPDLALQQLLQDRTLEMMMLQPEVSALQSGLDLLVDTTDKSHDKSRDMSRDRSRLGLEPPQMETISELDVTLFRKSAGAEQTIPEFEKDIPEIPEIPPPELPAPEPEPEKIQEQPAPEVTKSPIAPEQPQPQELVEIELEELEPQTKRRKIRKLIIDKKTKLGREYFKSRIENPMVELRCEDSVDDIIVIKVPVETYFKRPCHNGNKLTSNLGFEITRLFSRNLGIIPGSLLADREMEEAVYQRPKPTKRTLERIEEEQVPIQEIPEVVIQPPIEELEEIEPRRSEIEPRRSETEPRRSEVEPMDISEMLTQKVETLSQARKRAAMAESTDSPKRQRSGYMSFRESQKLTDKDVLDLDADANKENIPDNIQVVPNIEEIPEPVLVQDAELVVSSMLQQAGLADIQQPVIQESQSTQKQDKSGKKIGSDGSETPLGSLDRTKVSLGDSQQTTDSKRFIRDQWGTEGTMIKIIRFIKAGIHPINVRSLITKGPVMPGYHRMIAATCFTSILKLKHHRFIDISKDRETLEIRDITLGSKFANNTNE